MHKCYVTETHHFKCNALPLLNEQNRGPAALRNLVSKAWMHRGLGPAHGRFSPLKVIIQEAGQSLAKPDKQNSKSKSIQREKEKLN